MVNARVRIYRCWRRIVGSEAEWVALEVGEQSRDAMGASLCTHGLDLGLQGFQGIGLLWRWERILETPWELACAHISWSGICLAA